MWGSVQMRLSNLAFLVCAGIFVQACAGTKNVQQFRPDNAVEGQALLFSPMVRHGETLYLSGMIGFDSGTNQLPDNVSEQTANAFHAIEKTLQMSGANLSHLLSCTVYLADMKKYSEMNSVYASFFSANPPARTTVQVAALPLNAQVEISCIGRLPS